MTDQELSRIRETLVAVGRRIRGDFSAVADEALRSAGGDASGNLSNTPFHPADLANDNWEKEVDLSLLENEDRLLGEVSAAIGRIDAKAYGRCEVCGKEIPAERLRAAPWTRYCVEDAARQEREQGTALGPPAA